MVDIFAPKTTTVHQYEATHPEYCKVGSLAAFYEITDTVISRYRITRGESNSIPHPVRNQLQSFVK